MGGRRLQLGDRFLLLRRRLGVTQSELGRILGVHRNTIGRAERGGGGKGKELPITRKLREKFIILEHREGGK